MQHPVLSTSDTAKNCIIPINSRRTLQKFEFSATGGNTSSFGLKAADDLEPYFSMKNKGVQKVGKLFPTSADCKQKDQLSGMPPFAG